MEEYLREYAKLKKEAVDVAVGLFEKLIDEYDVEFVEEVVDVLGELVDLTYENEELEEFEEEEEEEGED